MGEWCSEYYVSGLFSECGWGTVGFRQGAQTVHSVVDLVNMWWFVLRSPAMSFWRICDDHPGEMEAQRGIFEK